MKAWVLTSIFIIAISMLLVGCGNQERTDKGSTVDRQDRDRMHERDMRRDMQRSEMERRREEDQMRQEHNRMEQGRIRQEFQDRMRQSRSEIEQARKDLAKREAGLREKAKQLADLEMSSMAKKMSELADQIEQTETRASTLAENIAILTRQAEDIASRKSN